ncbi:MAG: methylenetetrahydrofolate reductase [Mycobacteriales bacterium]
MVKIVDLLAAGRCYSFEFFPPKTPEAEVLLAQTLRELESLHPSFVSVTYGAGGSTRERTHDLVVEILDSTSMTPMAHLTCAAHSRVELAGILERYRDAGVDNVLCLGGDPPIGLDLPAGDLTHASELVALAREVSDFSLGVAAHPEGHPSSATITGDRDRTAEKLRDADFAVTQFFFRAADYFSLVEAMAARDVTRPIVPGIMPIGSLTGISRMAAMSGAAVPREVIDQIEPYADDPDAVRKCGVEIATALCRELLEGGAPGLHFYTLNRSTSTREIYANLGLGAAS